MNFSAVCIVGGGLIGGSISLALTKIGVPHYVQDTDDEVIQILQSKGDVQTLQAPEQIGIVFIAVPPNETSDRIEWALDFFPNAIIADVASVKGMFAEQISRKPSYSRYVGSHPMAGREVSGAAAADSNIFADRIWIVCVNNHNFKSAARIVELVSKFGAIPVELNAQDHDSLMAVVSHLPQLLSYELAKVAVDSEADLNLAGQGFRDMTRISSSSTDLWSQIFAVNHTYVKNVLDIYIDHLIRFSNALIDPDVSKISELLVQAQIASNKLPGKHGGKSAEYGVLKLRVKDEPGSLASLFNLAGQIHLNIEDVIIEHVLNRPIAVVTIMINKSEVERAREAFLNNGWDLRE